MNNQKKILEIFLYVLLIIVGLFFYLSDDAPLILTKSTSSSEKITPQISVVPSECIDYGYKFEED